MSGLRPHVGTAVARMQYSSREERKAAEMLDTVHCPNCGAVAAPQDAFCPECGSRISAGPSAAPPSGTPAPEPTTQTAQAPGPPPASTGPQAFERHPPSTAKTFLASLFDFGFTSFISERLIKVLYAIIAVAIPAVWLFSVLAALRSPTMVFFVVIIGAVAALLMLMAYRVLFEFLIVAFRAAVDIHAWRKETHSR